MAQMFFLTRKRTAPLDHANSLPPGMRIYAIGDVHGRLDCLSRIEDSIARHEAMLGDGQDAHVIFLGDYIDRGPSSRGVIEALVPRTFAGLSARHLLGNHEDAMLHFLASPRDGSDWLHFGGTATLASYGVGTAASITPAQLPAVAKRLQERLPEAHIAFLRELELTILLGGFLFVHAGIRPGIALAKQTRRDLLNIRDPFLGADRPLPWRVVHGHTIVEAAEITPTRISLDTGAYATGRLSCAVIEGRNVAILK